MSRNVAKMTSYFHRPQSYFERLFFLGVCSKAMFECVRALMPPCFCGHPVTTNIQFVLAHFFSHDVSAAGCWRAHCVRGRQAGPSHAAGPGLCFHICTQ